MATMTLTALLTMASLWQVDAVRPKDLTAESHEILARQKARDIDYEGAKEVFNKVFLEVQTKPGVKPDQGDTKNMNTGLFADDGFWMREYEKVKEVWDNLILDIHFNEYKSGLDEEKVAELKRGMAGLQSMTTTWKAAIQAMITSTAPQMTAIMDDPQDRDFLESISDLQQNARGATAYMNRYLKEHSGSMPHGFHGFEINTFLVPLALLKNNADTFKKMVKKFREIPLFADTEFGKSATLANAGASLTFVTQLHGFAMTALMEYEDDLTSSCEIPDRLQKDETTEVVTDSLTHSGLLKTEHRKAEHNFEAYMDGILYLEGTGTAQGQYSDAIALALEAVKTDPLVYLFSSFALATDWQEIW
eukprot:6466333-Amphidinium_carterae.2